ncbi:MAG: YncE family protein, partial [Candidatus Eiseniibacteriota bacterium]
MKWPFWMIAVCCALIGTPPALAESAPHDRTGQAVRAFVTAYGSGGVTIVDPEAARVVGTVKTGLHPFGVAIAPSGKEIYVSNEGDGTLSFISPATAQVVAKIPVGKEPRHVTVSTDGRYVFVALHG